MFFGCSRVELLERLAISGLVLLITIESNFLCDAADHGARSQTQSFVDQFICFFDQTSPIIEYLLEYCFLRPASLASLDARPGVSQRYMSQNSFAIIVSRRL